MDTYSLRFPDDDYGVAKRIEFEAANSAAALSIARSERAFRSAELWHGDQRLATLTRIRLENDDLWQISN